MKIYEPNYTQVPNSVFSILPHLNEGELKVLLAIIRKTLGWQKKRDRISISQLIKVTGLGRATVCGVIKGDGLKGIIRVHKTKKGNEYELIIHDLASSKSEPPNDKVVQNLNPSSSKSELVASSESEHTKETLKETIQKKEEAYASIPTLDEVKAYFIANGYKVDAAIQAYNLYNTSVEDNPRFKYWRDSRGNKILNWKMKMRSVWFKEENKAQTVQPRAAAQAYQVIEN